jgi:cytosine/adenosine deaminase-related metal-dependent hydrolase
MTQLYDAAASGDFADPPQRLSWMRDETHRLQALTDRQLRAVARLALAELCSRGVDIRNHPDDGTTGLAMGLMFAAGAIVGSLVTFLLFMAVFS